MPLRSIEIDPFLYRKNPNTVGLDGCEVLLCDPCAREMCPVCDTYVSRGSAPPGVSFYRIPTELYSRRTFTVARRALPLCWLVLDFWK